MHKVELLAEAFNLDSLKLNIENGCDAVYIGDELKNFSIDELKKSVEYAHNRDKKVYVSLNKIPHENDINEIKRYIKSLIDTGIDAIVVIEPLNASLYKSLELGLSLVPITFIILLYTSG